MERVRGGPRQTSLAVGPTSNQEQNELASGRREIQSALPLRGGQLLSEISTGIVKLMREHYGRGPIKAKTYAEFQPAGREDARRRGRPTTIKARLWHKTANLEA